MRTMMLTGAGRMEMRETPEPLITGPGDVKIAMKVVGVCGSDIHYYLSGRIGSQVVEYPFPVGHEGAGEVVDTGPGVKGLKQGDRVAIEPAMPCGKCDQCLAGRPHTCRSLRFLGCPGQAWGCLSDYIVMPSSSCVKIPDSMTLEEAALSEPLAIGVYAVRQSILSSGQTAGILGFGPIGMSVMLAARNKGAGRIFVTDRIGERISFAAQRGADWTGNPDTDDIAGEITGREPCGLDIVFECCGKQEAIDQAVELVKPGGKIMIVGIPEFDNWSFSADMIRRKEITLINIRRQNHALDETLEMISGGKADVKTMVTHRFPFERSVEAFDLVAGYRDGVMKGMILW